MLNQMLNIASKHRSPQKDFYLGAYLAFIAGAINAGGFFIVQQYTSHMTGLISQAADNLALGRFVETLILVSFILCFILGAIFTTIITLKAKKMRSYALYAIPLSIESIILIFITFLWGSQQHLPSQVNLFICMLCFLMGLQNALITKASSAIVRTTHITGMSTDLGIEIGRAIIGKNKHYNELDKNKALIHFIIIPCFFIGGILGAFGVKFVGVYTFLPLAIMLMAISISQIKRDIVFSIRYSRRIGI